MPGFVLLVGFGLLILLLFCLVVAVGCPDQDARATAFVIGFAVFVAAWAFVEYVLSHPELMEK